MSSKVEIRLILLVIAGVFFSSCSFKHPALSKAEENIRRDELELASQTLQKALEDEQNKAEIFFMLGQISFLKEDYYGLKKYYDSSLFVSDEFNEQITFRINHLADSLGKDGSQKYARAYELLNLKEVKAAKAAFNEALPVLMQSLIFNDKNSELLKQIADVNLQLNNKVEAEKYYLAVFEIDSNDIEALNNLVLIQLDSKKPEAAEKYLFLRPQKNITNNIFFKYNIIKLADLYCQQKKFKKALFIYDELQKQQPLDFKINFNKAVLYCKLNRFAEAKKLFGELLAKTPKDQKIRMILASLYFEDGNYPEVLFLLEKYLSDFQGADKNIGLDYLLQSYLKLDMKKEFNTLKKQKR